MKAIGKILFGALLLSFTISSCTKDDDDDNNNNNNTGSNYNTQSSIDNAKMDSEFESMGSIVQEVIEDYADSLGNQKKAAGCAVITIDTTIKRITVDFGTGCSDYDGRTRTGKLHLDYTGAYRDAGSVITTSTENYTVDGALISGQRVVTNTGGDFGSGGITFDVEVSAVGDPTGYAMWTDGTDTITWKSTRTRTWTTDGSTILNPCDDIYEIYGSADGVNRDGLAFTMSVEQTDPLVVDLSCYCSGYRIPKDGVLTITPDGLDDRIIDYGEGGGCDYSVGITIGIFSFPLTLQ